MKDLDKFERFTFPRFANSLERLRMLHIRDRWFSRSDFKKSRRRRLNKMLPSPDTFKQRRYETWDGRPWVKHMVGTYVMMMPQCRPYQVLVVRPVTMLMSVANRRKTAHHTPESMVSLHRHHDVALTVPYHLLWSA